MQKIKFIANSTKLDNVLIDPSPAQKNLPSWYKKMSKYFGEYERGTKVSFSNFTIKACPPIFDALSMGYLVYLNTDILVRRDSDETIDFLWRNKKFVWVEEHYVEQTEGLPEIKGFEKQAHKWLNAYKIITPKGYSSFFVHPIGRDHLPFKSFSAVVDTDRYPNTVHFPFLLEKDFTGIIPRGTPIIQIIPFKRESWKSTIEKVDDFDEFDNSLFSAYIKDVYKNFYKTAKIFK
jgi:hypothetical protein